MYHNVELKYIANYINYSRYNTSFSTRKHSRRCICDKQN